MPNTPKLNWPYPSREQDPWYDAFVSFIEAADASVYMSREDRNLILHGGGSISFAAPNLTWTGTLYVISPVTGYYAQIAAGTVALAVGQVAYIEMPRAMTANQTVTVSVANQVPNTDTALVLAVRLGSNVVFRNGLVVADGAAPVVMGTGLVPISAKGSLVVGNATGVPVQLPVGADGLALVADSAQPNGVKWGGADHGMLVGLADNDHPQYQLVSEKGANNGYAGLDSRGTVTANAPTAIPVFSDRITDPGWLGISGMAGAFDFSELPSGAFGVVQPSTYFPSDTYFLTLYQDNAAETPVFADGTQAVVAPDTGSSFVLALPANGAASVDFLVAAQANQFFKATVRHANVNGPAPLQAYVDGVLVSTANNFARHQWTTLTVGPLTAGMRTITLRVNAGVGVTAMLAIDRIWVGATNVVTYAAEGVEAVVASDVNALTRPILSAAGFGDDFNGAALNPVWRTGSIGNPGTVAITTLEPSGVRLTTGVLAADGVYADWGGKGPILSRTQPWRCKWRVRLSSVADVQVYIGAANLGDVGELEMVAFRYDTSVAATWQVVTADNIGAVSNAFSPPYDTLAPDTNWHEYEIRFNPNTGSYVFALDGTCVLSFVGSIPSVAIAPCLRISTLVNAANWLDADYVDVTAKRSLV